MPETELEAIHPNSIIQHGGPMVDLELMLRTPGLTLRRAFIIHCIKVGVDTNGDIADTIGCGHPLVSYEVGELRKLGYIHEADPHTGSRTKPIRITGKGTRLYNKMLNRH